MGEPEEVELWLGEGAGKRKQGAKGGVRGGKDTPEVDDDAFDASKLLHGVWG